MGNLISTNKYNNIYSSYNNNKQKCPFMNCNEFHKSSEHICTICGIQGHEDIKDMHEKCYICKDKIKYTHHTDGHISYIGIKNMSEDEKDKFKYCKTCNKTGYTKNNKCIFCENEVSEIIKCSRNNCGYIDKNSIKRYCPYCGKHITS